MATRAWAIKLGSGGRCVSFCEHHQIVGVGWSEVDPGVLRSAGRDELWAHVKETCAWYRNDARAIGTAVGQLYRFARECAVGDYVLYYDPPKKHVRIAKITSEPRFRDFEPEVDIDIWHYRTIELAPKPIPILDFYGSLKGALLGPRMSFWEVRDRGAVDALFRGASPHLLRATDRELEQAYETLKRLLVARAETLTDTDWEALVADYLKAQGAYVDDRRVGKSRPVIDVEAVFRHGELGDDVWRVQVKRFQDQKVDWSAIEKDFHHVGEARFCYVSVFGFTEEARKRAEDARIVLLEAGDFAPFLLSGKLRQQLADKLRLPQWGLPGPR